MWFVGVSRLRGVRSFTYGERVVTFTLADTVARNVAHAMAVAEQNPHSLHSSTGIPRPTIIRRLKGESPFTVAELDRIAYALDVPVQHFFAQDPTVSMLAPREPAA